MKEKISILLLVLLFVTPAGAKGLMAALDKRMTTPGMPRVRCTMTMMK